MALIKVTNGLETRRLQVTPAEITFEQLKERLSSSFPGEVTAEKPLSLQYRDSDGDVITISSDAELQGALADLPQESTLKLHIQTKPAKQSDSGRRFGRRAHHPAGRSIFDLLFEPSTTSVWDSFDKQFRQTESLLQQLWGKECCSGEACETTESKETTESQINSETQAEASATPSETPAGDSGEKNQTDAPETDDGDTVKSKVPEVPVKKSPAVRRHTYVAWEPRLQYTWFGPRAVLRPVTYNVLSCEWSSEDEKKPSPQEATAQ